MNKIISITLAIMLIASCAREEELPSGLRAGGFKPRDDSRLQEILNRLKSKNIPYEIDERGFVNYMQKDKASVLGILRTVRDGEQLTNKVIESEVATSERHRKLMVAKLEEQGIPYRIDSFGGTEQITWIQLYGPRVDQIIQEVGFELHQKATYNTIKETQ